MCINTHTPKIKNFKNTDPPKNNLKIHIPPKISKKNTEPLKKKMKKYTLLRYFRFSKIVVFSAIDLKLKSKSKIHILRQ